MPNTFIKIATVSVGASGTSSIDFTSIPGTYTDLKILCSLRTDSSASSYGEMVYLKFNGSTSNFSLKRLEGYGTTVTGSSETDARFGRANNASQTASAFANIMVYIPNYANSTNKPWYSDAVNDTNGSTNEMFFHGALWSNTAAITSISIVGSEVGSKFVQYSTATLYGIKNS
jgi:hypothetical protein